eukprot:TRINITY_DN4425_c0_g1_i1.p1 TRINITY_DN4425_c0_g1~~TRINITY_DN4425_c0_g1_i1.p1  ORF type:complete len:128 (-),score=12.70 TRINITY_DN4425_c0_g1_i1:167-550(-)
MTLLKRFDLGMTMQLVYVGSPEYAPCQVTAIDTTTNPSVVFQSFANFTFSRHVTRDGQLEEWTETKGSHTVRYLFDPTTQTPVEHSTDSHSTVFTNFQVEELDASVFAIPSACDTAVSEMTPTRSQS